MKTVALSTRRSRRAAFTLLEVSTAMGLMLVLGSSLVVMLQQHVTFMGLAQRQSFLADEAPKIGNVVGRIFSQVDHFMVHDTHDAAVAGGTPVLAGGRAVRLFFRAADQSTEIRIVSVQPLAEGVDLRFYHTQADGTLASWSISDRLNDASFAVDQGILTITLSGPNGEIITYGGSAR